MYLIVGAAMVYALYARIIMSANKAPGAGVWAEFTGELTERGKRYQRRSYIAMVVAGLGVIVASLLQP